jgi:hypothetical protein
VPAPRIAELVLAAGEYVRRALGVELDGSIESLAYVDHYLAGIGPISDEVLTLVSAALGAYFGEVAIGQLGGTWRTVDEDAAEWTISLGAAPLTFHPAAMVAEAIRQDEVDGYDARISTTPALEGPLEEALAAVAPVEASYYYSLTGRLETLEHAAEIIAEVRRREQQ